MIIKKNKSGFLLVSLVVYAAITVLLVSVMVRLALIVIPATTTLMDWCSYTPFYTAYDFIAKEISLAPSDAASWLKADTDGFIWRSGDLTKAIMNKQGNLIYKEGTYNTNGSTWSGTSTSLLARNCVLTDVHTTLQGGQIQEFYCRAEIVGKPGYCWEYRRIFNEAV